MVSMRQVLLAVSIGPGIVIPVILLAVLVPLGLMWGRRTAKRLQAGVAPAPIPGARVTSAALHTIKPVGWRTVLEVPSGTLGDIDQVLIGPPGVFAVTTSMTPMPVAGTIDPTDALATAAAAVARGALDDVLRPYRMESVALVTVHWDQPGDRPITVDTAYGAVAVDGHQLAPWLVGLDGDDLTPAQVDLAWQAVTKAVGRPDPLA
jgi:hypothetical protein